MFPQMLIPGYLLITRFGWETRELKKRKKTDPKERQRQGDILWICTCQQNQINVNSCMFKKMRRFLSSNITLDTLQFCNTQGTYI